MVTNTLIVMSRGVSVDPSDDLLSISKMIDRLNFTFDEKDLRAGQKEKIGREKVLLPTSFSLSTVWRGDKLIKGIDVAVSVAIISPTGEVLDTMNMPIAVTNSSRSIRSLISFDKIPIKEAGVYEMDATLKRDDKELAVATCKFEVRFYFKKSVSSDERER